MQIVLTLLETAARFILTAYSLFLLMRAILPFLPFDEDGPVAVFVNTVTEPLLSFVRGFMDRIPGADRVPIDLSLIVAYLLLILIELILIMLS